MFDDVRYEVHPRMFRMRPLATLLVLVLRGLPDPETIPPLIPGQAPAAAAA